MFFMDSSPPPPHPTLLYPIPLLSNYLQHLPITVSRFQEQQKAMPYKHINFFHPFFSFA